MASFGENLRREREMRGVTLQEISAASKISVRFFQALEVDDFSKLPGGIFTRSFIRAYARYLGLDEESVLAEYQLIAPPQADFDLKRLTHPKPMLVQESSRAPFLGLLVAAAMLVSGYALYRYSHRVAETQGNASNPVRFATAPSSEASQSPEERSLARASTATRTVPATGSSSAAGAGSQTLPGHSGLGPTPARGGEGDSGLVLQVAATERAWVAVESDGRTTLQRVLNPNEIETLKARNSFDVTTGNAQGIILTLNGETLKPLGRRGEVRSIHLTHDDLKNPVP